MANDGAILDALRGRREDRPDPDRPRREQRHNPARMIKKFRAKASPLLNINALSAPSLPKSKTVENSFASRARP
jgi:hypothetical protein